MSSRVNFTNSIPVEVVKSGTGLTTVTSYPEGRKATESTSGVKRRKPLGWIPPTNYAYDRTMYIRAQGSCTKRLNNGNYTTFSGNVGGGNSASAFNSLNTYNEAYIPNVSFSAMQDRALVDARLAMKRSDVNLGVAFAERNRTAQLIGNNATAIAQCLRRLRRGDFKGAGRALGVTTPGKPRGSGVTARWLELQYGWKPLLSDVYGAADALAKRGRHDWIVTGKGAYREDIDLSVVHGSGHSRCRTEVKGRKGVYVRIDAIPENELLQSLAALGITNPLLIAWELVPYSFVLDWFLPVGSFVESLDAMLGYGPTWCSISHLENTRWSSRGISYENASERYENSWSSSKHYVYLRRSALTSVPLPTLPRFKDPFSLGHMANGLSLLSQALQGFHSAR